MYRGVKGALYEKRFILMLAQPWLSGLGGKGGGGRERTLPGTQDMRNAG
jgi:hypothetical protein